MAQSQESAGDSPTQRDGAPAASHSDLAQAYRDLARGEQAATALEANLSKIESTLDALLARFDSMEEEPSSKGSHEDNQPKDQTQGGSKATDGKQSAPAE